MTKWFEPKHPGDSVRLQGFARDGEVGDVRIQGYAPNSFRVASFLPGVTVEYEGDTPKTEPEFDQWVRTRDHADNTFDMYCRWAVRDGWTPVQPKEEK
jgi:hypothetical protein